MIADKTKEIINKIVDDYIDEMRFDVIYLGSSREINEASPGKFIVQDTDLIIDRSRSYDEILRHPVEDFFIPEKVDLYVVEFIVELELPELVSFSNFDASGIIHQEEIPIEDFRISDGQLESLLNYTCFDINYQKIYPEVKPYLEEIYKQKHAQNIKDFLERAKPFLFVV